MAKDLRINEQINTLIQKKLKGSKLREIDPVTATRWLVKAGIRKKMESRPGSYLRSLCRKGIIKGARKRDSKWSIVKLRAK